MTTHTQKTAIHQRSDSSELVRKLSLYKAGSALPEAFKDKGMEIKREVALQQAAFA
jgi:hypothetical protein